MSCTSILFFLIPKSKGSLRPVLDLYSLKFIKYMRFCMVSPASIIPSLDQNKLVFSSWFSWCSLSYLSPTKSQEVSELRGNGKLLSTNCSSLWLIISSLHVHKMHGSGDGILEENSYTCLPLPKLLAFPKPFPSAGAPLNPVYSPFLRLSEAYLEHREINIRSHTDAWIPQSLTRLHISKCLPSPGKVSDYLWNVWVSQVSPIHRSSGVPHVARSHGCKYLCTMNARLCFHSLQAWLISVYQHSWHHLDKLVQILPMVLYSLE